MLNWLIKSSEDPTKLSLTCKAGIPFVITIAAYFGLNLEVNDLEALIGSLVMLSTGATTTYGLIRKIRNTIKKK